MSNSTLLMLILPWPIGFVFDVILGGKNKTQDFQYEDELGSWYWWMIFSYDVDEISHQVSQHTVQKLEYIQAFFWDSYWHGKFLTPLKHLQVSDLPIINIGIFLPTKLPAANLVKWTLLCSLPASHPPFKCNACVGSCWKNNPKSSVLKISFNSYQERIAGRCVCSQFAVIPTVEDLSLWVTVQKIIF